MKIFHRIKPVIILKVFPPVKHEIQGVDGGWAKIRKSLPSILQQDLRPATLFHVIPLSFIEPVLKTILLKGPSIKYVRSKGQGGFKVKTHICCFYDVILLFKSVPEGRVCQKITNFDVLYGWSLNWKLNFSQDFLYCIILQKGLIYKQM